MYLVSVYLMSTVQVSVPHSAVQLLNTAATARPRTSIETRCIVRFSD